MFTQSEKNNLYLAFDTINERYCQTLAEGYQTDTIVFSKDFENKMEKLLVTNQHFAYKITHFFARHTNYKFYHRNKLLPLLILILLMSSVCNGYVFATSSNANTTKPLVSVKPIVTRDDATDTIKLFINGETLKLEYVETHNLTTIDYINQYTDEQANIYHFDKENNLVSVYMNKTTQQDAPAEKISEEQALKIAYKYFSTIYGDYLSEFEHTKTIHSDGSEYYYLFFEKKYGPNDLATGEMCYVRVLTNGEVLDWSLAKVDKMKNFDKSCLDGINSAELTDYARQQMNTILPQTAENYTQSGVYIELRNNKYVLRIEMTNNITGDIQEIYYEI